MLVLVVPMLRGDGDDNDDDDDDDDDERLALLLLVAGGRCHDTLLLLSSAECLRGRPSSEPRASLPCWLRPLVHQMACSPPQPSKPCWEQSWFDGCNSISFWTQLL